MSDNSRPILQIVGGREDGRRRNVTQWRCGVCEREGRASGALMSVFLEADVQGGEIKPLHPALVCMSCHYAGKITVI